MLHHALLYRAPTVSRETVLDLIPKLHASEVEFVEIDSFGIDDVRNLTLKAYRVPSQGERLGIVVVVRTMTIESEQALLKLLEEPPATTVFLFCIPEDVFLLPTVLSRFSKIDNSYDRKNTEAFANFANLTLTERISIIASKHTSKDQVWQQDIKQGLLWFLDTNWKKCRASDLEILHYVAAHLLTRGSSNKQLLEELAFTLPLDEKAKNVTL